MYSHNGFDPGQTQAISKNTLSLNVPQLFFQAFGRKPTFDEAREIGMQFAAKAASENTNGPEPSYWEDAALVTPSPALQFLKATRPREITPRGSKPAPEGF